MELWSFGAEVDWSGGMGLMLLEASLAVASVTMMVSLKKSSDLVHSSV